MEKVIFYDVIKECIEGAAIVGLGAVLLFLSLTAYGAIC